MKSLQNEVQEALTQARHKTEFGRALGTRPVVIKGDLGPAIQYFITMLDAQHALLERLAAVIDDLRSRDLGKLK